MPAIVPLTLPHGESAMTLDVAPNRTAVLVPDVEGDDWYEHGFTRVEGSRKRGVTSMPASAAHTLLRWEGYSPKADLSRRLVIDPACGSGTALLAAAQMLAARGRIRRWGAERVAQEIEQCLWGLDPDPIACHVTELRLRRLIGHIIPDLPAARRRTLQLHIHQTDSLVLPADARFHIVITNPPLATARGVVISHSGFGAPTPPRDVWLRFLEQSMRLVAYGGALAIALPEAILTKPVASTLRDELAREWTIERVGHLTGVFRSGPGTVLLLARRQDPTPDSVVQWERFERLSAPGESGRLVRVERRMAGSLPQSRLGSGPRGGWRYALSDAERAFVERMAQPGGTIGRALLGSLVEVSRGAEIAKEAADPIPTPAPGTVAILRAIDVAPFHARSRFWLARDAFKSDPAAWRGPKIVIPRANPRMIAALDTSGAAPLAALFTLRGGQTHDDDLPWLVALLSSRAMRAYLTLTQTAYSLARPTIELAALGRLPVAIGPADARQRLKALGIELARHAESHGTASANDEHYPVAERLAATIDLEVTTLYGLTLDDLAVVDRWQG